MGGGGGAAGPISIVDLCVARLRVAVGAGIWRANHKTLGAWAERAYPEGHLIDNNEGAAAA